MFSGIQGSRGLRTPASKFRAPGLQGGKIGALGRH